MSTNKCRVCLGRELLTSIFHKRGTLKISTKVMSIAKVNISPDDGLPSTICSKCIQRLDDCIEFVQLCESSDSQLRATLPKVVVLNILEADKNMDCNNDDYSLNIEEECKLSPKSDLERDLLIDERTVNHSFLEHDTQENNILNANTKDFKNDKTIQKQQCFTCGKVMSSRFRLKTHLRTHTGERPFSCPHCSKNFSLAQNLKVHIRVHTGEKPLRCSVCGETFAQSAGLAAHRRKHTGQTPYRCVLCPRSFRTVGHLQYHVRRHTGEKNFECDTCGKAFITRSDLKQHLLTHSGDRRHVCCVCGLRLTRASHLKRHLQHMHNSQKQFTCDECTSKFDQKDDYEKHKKIHIDARELEQSNVPL